jgi:hypothetical protein
LVVTPPLRGGQCRCRAEDPFKMAKKSKKSQMLVVRRDEADRTAEAAKTTRLRALRLAKEAADKDAAKR